MTLTPCQQRAFDVLLREGNVFLTGAAGTGKSFLLSHYLSGKPATVFPVVASTGAAAVIVSGRTFHSFFGLGILEGGPDATVAKALRSGRLVNRLNRAQCVIIDEISMLSGTMLQTAERIARRARECNAPWGGLRIIAVGDFAQLPPITQMQEEKDWAFLHPVWEESDFQPALLSTVMRTQDTEFLRILNFVREGIVNDEVSAYLNSRTRGSLEHAEGTRLYPHRAQAERYNLERLSAINKLAYAFKTEYAGREAALEHAKKSIPIPEILHIKEDALVMMRKNDDAMRYVNGSLGIVRRIGDDVIMIRLLSGEEITVVPEKFSYLDGDGKETVAAWNFPVMLAWATTIHKAQGASLDRMIVDLGRLWEPGQAYVAMSRVRSGAGLMIERWQPSSITAEPLVTAFYNALADRAKKYVPRALFTVQYNASGESERESRMTRAPRTARRSTVKTIRSMLAAKESLDAIAAACGIQTGTVLQWIEKIIALGAPVDLRYLLENIQEAENIRTAFQSLGMERLRPVFDHFEEAVPYDSLRLVRCAMRGEEKMVGHPG